MKILVTGAAGFIGFHTINKFLSEGHEVVGLDNVNDYYSTQLKYARLNELGFEIGKIKWYSLHIARFNRAIFVFLGDLLHHLLTNFLHALGRQTHHTRFATSSFKRALSDGERIVLQVVENPD